MCMLPREPENLPLRRVVLGLGNLLSRDEGVGIHAIRVLSNSMPPDNGFVCVDGGVLGMGLLPLIEACSHLLVLDAIDAGQSPGTVIELEKDQIPLFSTAKLSEHQVGFQEVLGLAHFRNHFPCHMHLVGVQPHDLSSGLELSPSVSRALPQVVARAIAWMQTFS
jgi:hydrogenase maturation protease